MLEAVVGGLWWVVGSLALPGGANTLVLAGGLGITAALWRAATRRPGAEIWLPPGGLTRLAWVGGSAVVMVIAAAVALGSIGWAELTVPVACGLVGAHFLPLASITERRPYLAVGAALMVIGATGALLALNSAGSLYPQGFVGFLAAVAVWAAAVQRLGLARELAGRLGSR